jgi:hypothetical protein
MYKSGVPCLFGSGLEAPAACGSSTYTNMWLYKMLPCHEGIHYNLEMCNSDCSVHCFCGIVDVFGLNVQTPSIIIHLVAIYVERTLGSVQDSLRLGDSITDD